MAGFCEMERFLLFKGSCDDSGGHRRWEWQSDGGRGASRGWEEGETISLKQGVRQPSAFKPELRGFLIMLTMTGGGEMWAFGYY